MLGGTAIDTAAFLASSVVVAGGIGAATRVIWRASIDIRDNRAATRENTAALTDLSSKMDGRVTHVEDKTAEHDVKLADHEVRITHLERP